MALRTVTIYVNGAGNKMFCDTKIETVTTHSFLNLHSFHVIYLPSTSKCGKQVSGVGGIWALASKKKNLGEILILSPPAVPLGQFTQLQSWLPHRLMRDDRVGG